MHEIGRPALQERVDVDLLHRRASRRGDILGEVAQRPVDERRSDGRRRARGRRAEVMQLQEPPLRVTEVLRQMRGRVIDRGPHVAECLELRPRPGIDQVPDRAHERVIAIIDDRKPEQ